MSERVTSYDPSRPIEKVERVQRRTIMMPRGQKTTAVRETKVSMPRLRCLENTEDQR